jgi:hypothetical protein
MGRSRRGQTTIDFAVGMGIFLLALAFVFVFVPGMLEPFSGGTQSETPGANRVADDLVTRTLGDASQPYVLDRKCTLELFNGSSGGCRFDDGTMPERVGVKERTRVNVTIRGELDGDGQSDILCWDGDSTPSKLVERGHTGCTPGTTDVFLLTNGSLPEGSGGQTVSAQRVALLDERDVTLEVVMW